MSFLTMLYITLSSCYIADWSGLMDNLDYYLFYKFHYKNVKYQSGMYVKKPFTCPGCLSFWISVIFILISPFTIMNILLPFSVAALATLLNKIYYKLL